MQNPTLLQFYHWYTPADQQLWKQLAAAADQLAEWGINIVWTPPAQKASAGGMSVGYDTYDLYDLGEFDQKGSIPTKYGTRKELAKAIKALAKHRINVMADIVMNHKGGADGEERFFVERVNPDDRNHVFGDPFEINAWTKFSFPGRKGKYSDFVWDFQCFSGVDYASDLQERAIFVVKHDYDTVWEQMADMQMGNYDYLMYADVEFRNPAVQAELKHWGEWMVKEVGFNSFRLDAIKHMSPLFVRDWLNHVRGATELPLFSVGEYWSSDLNILQHYIGLTEGTTSLFDVPLHMKFHQASKSGKDFDLRTIYNDTLTQVNPMHSVPFVDNHDSQPLQSLESPVDPWFKPIAYALILLREQGIPCVFHPDIYGAVYTDKGNDGNDHEIHLPPVRGIQAMMIARKNHAYGPQTDYFDDPNLIGWTRAGVEEQAGTGCAVLLSNGDGGSKYMRVGERHANATFMNVLSEQRETVQLDPEGGAVFTAPPGSVAVWVPQHH
jgi:alpha-amylase